VSDHISGPGRDIVARMLERATAAGEGTP